MSSQPRSRHRKQHFPRLERRKLGTQSLSFPDSDSDDDPVYFTKYSRLSHIPSHKPFRPMKESKEAGSGRTDKRARDEHNEQERSRRRELAVIYELIRNSISANDMHLLGHCNGPKSVEKLSYPQVLHVAHQLVLEEHHNLILFERSLNDIKLIERQFLRTGLPLLAKPKCPPITDNYRKMVQLVDDLLRHDKICRSVDGVYDVTPSERAAIGEREIVYPTPSRASSVTDYSNRIGSRRSCNSKNRSSYDDNYYVKREENSSCLSNWSNPSANQSTMKRSSSSASLDNDDDLDFDDVLDYDNDDNDSNTLSPSPPSITNAQSPSMWLDNYEFLDILTKIKEDPDYAVDNFGTTSDDEFSEAADLDSLIRNFKAEEPLD